MFSYYILVSLYDSRNIPQRECSGNRVIGTEQLTNRTLRTNSLSTRPCWQNSLPTRRCWRNSLSTRPCWQNNCQTRPCWQNDLSTSLLVGWFSSPSHKRWDGSARRPIKLGRLSSAGGTVQLVPPAKLWKLTLNKNHFSKIYVLLS